MPVKMVRSVKRRDEHWEKKRRFKKRQRVTVKVPAYQNERGANGSVDGKDSHALQGNRRLAGL